MNLRILKNQIGAMFGLDARITLTVFALLSVAGGVIVATRIADVTSGSLADELSQYALAVESFHVDLNEDIYAAINSSPSKVAKDAVQALYDRNMVKNKSHWLGPYLKHFSTQHNRFGEMRIIKAQESANVRCAPGRMCYLWWAIEDVPMDVIHKTDATFDGKTAASLEEGRVQGDASRKDETFGTLYFRVSRALRMN